MTCQDWRDASAGEIASLIDTERRRWIDRLSWDTAPSFAIVETGRRNGVVPGWIARNDAGVAEGWIYYVLHDGDLQIGGLTAVRPAVARRLIDAVLNSAEAALARRLSCFVFPESGSVASAFERQRFVTGQTSYLMKPLDLAMPSSPRVVMAHEDGLRPWRDIDLAPAVRLLAASYRGVPGAACFAPEGGLEQWAHYTSQLTRVPACGDFDPTLSVVAPTAVATELAGIVLTTRISSDTAHIAQLAVSPAVRRTGLARRLLASVFSACHAAGLNAITLMVDSGNAPAASLYEDVGFSERARFLYGSRPARTRVAA